MKKKEEGKKEKVSLSDFKKVLKILKSMLNDGDIKIDFAPYGRCGVTTESDRLDKELTSSKIDRDIFDRGRDECIPLLNDILSDKEKRFLKRIPAAEKEEMEKKCEMIEKEIITVELVEKFLFQTTCKNYLLEAFNWEMIEHRGKEEEESLSTVMMQFKLRNPSKELMLPLSVGVGFESISFECMKENIGELIEELAKIKKRFEK